MELEAWKTALIKEIEIAAEGRAELARADPQIEKSRVALFDFVEQLRRLPPDYVALNALIREEWELSNLMRALVGEAEHRSRHAKDDLPAAYGVDREPFDVVDVIVRQAHALRARRHRLFGLMGDIGRIARADAKYRERAGVSQGRVPDLRVELIDVLMLALHNVSRANNSDGWISVPAAPRICPKMFSEEVRL